MNQASIGTEATGEVVDRLVAPHGFRKPTAAAILRRPFCELSLVVGLKRDAIGIHLLQITPNFWRIDAGIEIGQIPFRQFAGL